MYLIVLGYQRSAVNPPNAHTIVRACCTCGTRQQLQSTNRSKRYQHYTRFIIVVVSSFLRIRTNNKFNFFYAVYSFCFFNSHHPSDKCSCIEHRYCGGDVVVSPRVILYVLKNLATVVCGESIRRGEG